MAGRPPAKKANIEALQLLALSTESIVDLRPIIAYTMHYCGTTYREIGEVFSISYQMAQQLVEQARQGVK
jgi:transposase